MVMVVNWQYLQNYFGYTQTSENANLQCLSAKVQTINLSIKRLVR